MTINEQTTSTPQLVCLQHEPNLTIQQIVMTKANGETVKYIVKTTTHGEGMFMNKVDKFI